MGFLGRLQYLIDRKGKIQFENSCQSWTFAADSNSDRYRITTFSGKQGVIDHSNRLVIDTLYQYIHSFADRVAVVVGLRHNPSPRSDDADQEIRYEVGVVDDEGRVIVPFGRYASIEPFHEGLAKVEFLPNYSIQPAQYGFIDVQGNLQFIIGPHIQLSDLANYSEGLLAVKLQLGEPGTLYGGTTGFLPGYLTKKGKVTFIRPTLEEARSFHLNRAFVRTSKGEWYLYFKQGKIVN